MQERYKVEEPVNEAKYRTLVVKMSFICTKIKKPFHINDFPLSYALKHRDWLNLRRFGNGPIEQ